MEVEAEQSPTPRCRHCFAATDKQRLQDTLANTFMQATDQDMGFKGPGVGAFSFAISHAMTIGYACLSFKSIATEDIDRAEVLEQDSQACKLPEGVEQ